MVRVAVALLDEASKTASPPQTRQAEADVSNYARTLDAACDQYSIPPSDRANWVLQVEATKAYAQDNESLQAALQGMEKSTPLVHLRKKPSFRATNDIQALNEAAESSKDIKDLVFHLKNKLTEPEYAEAFIELSGVTAILRCISNSRGNAQTYALAALRAAMEYVSGMEIVMNTPTLIKELYTLADSTVVGVCRGALELLFVMVGFRKDTGFISLHRAAKAVAQAQGESPYGSVIKLIERGGDLETMVNAFTLLNVMLITCPNDAKATKLLKGWGDQGLNDKLRAVTDIQHNEFQAQLEIYEETSGVNLRTKASRLEGLVRSLRAKLHTYEEQQALVMILREELRRTQHFIREAWESGVLVSSAPMKRFLGPLQPEYPADLSFLRTAQIEREKVQGLRDEREQIKKTLDTLQAQVAEEKENTEELKLQLHTTRTQAQETATALERESGNLHRAVERAKLLEGQLVAVLKELEVERYNAGKFDSATLLAPYYASLDPTAVAAARAATISSATSSLTPSTDAAVTTPPAEDVPPPPSGGPPPPPPPGMKGPPPPPMAKAIRPNKPPVQPGTKMKPLYWKRIIMPQTTRPTVVWDEVIETKLDTVEIETMFGQRPREAGPESNSVQGGGAYDPKTKEKPMTVLDAKRSNAVSIMMAKLPQTNVLVTAIDNMDVTILSKEAIRALITTGLPTPEEVTALTAPVVIYEKLDRPDKFLLEMSRMPKLKERLKCWLFQLDLQEVVLNIKKQIEQIGQACSTVRGSDNLKKVLGTILSIGNYMNGGSAQRGQADGFGLEILDSLATTKDQENKVTLLEYSVRVVRNRYPRALTLVEEMAGVSPAVGSLQDLQADILSLVTSVKNARADHTAMMDSAILSLPEVSKFATTLPKIMNGAANVSERFQTQYDGVVEQYRSLLEYFGYPRSAADKDVPTTTLFGWLHQFMLNFEKTWEKYEKQEAEAKRLAARGNNAAIGKDVGKKIAGGADPLAALANAIKSGQTQLQGQRKKVPVAE